MSLGVSKANLTEPPAPDLTPDFVNALTPFNNYATVLSSQSVVQVGQNLITLLFIDIPYSVTIAFMDFNFGSGGNGITKFNIGLYTLSGVKVCDIGPQPTPGAGGYKSYATAQGKITLPAGRYLVAMTGNSNVNEATVVTSTPEYLGSTYSSSTGTTGCVLPPTIQVTVSPVGLQTGGGTAAQPLISLHA